MYIPEYFCLLESISGCATFLGAMTDTSFPTLSLFRYKYQD